MERKDDPNRPLREELKTLRERVSTLKKAEAETRKAEAALEARALYWTTVSEIGQSALSGKDLPTLMDEAAARVARCLDVPFASVLELLPDGSAFIVRSGVGWREGVVGRATVPARGGSMAGHTLLSPGPLVVEDLTRDSRFHLSPVLHEHKVVSGLCVRLRGRDRPYGVLSAHATSRRIFAKVDADFMEAVANVLSAAIERKRAEEALRESERRFRDVVENVHLVSVMLNPRGTILFCNDFLLRLTGWRREEVVGRNWFQTFLPPDVQPAVQGLFEEAIRKGAVLPHHENPIRTRAGEHRLIAWNNTVLRDLQGHVVGTMSLGEDVTERKRVEEAIRESEERYRLLFESNPHPMWVSDAETLRFLAVNEAAVRSYMYAREEFLGMTIKDIRPPEDVPALLEALARVPKGLYFPGIWRHRKRDGTIIDVEVTTHTLLFAGRPAILALASDITDRRRAEAALAAEKERLAVTLRSIGDGVITTDTEGRVLLMNKVAEQLTGHRGEQAAGQPLAEIFRVVDEATGAPLGNPVDEVLRAGGTFMLSRGTLLVSRDGAQRAIADSGAPIRDRDGKVIGVVLVFRDITERRRTEEELVKAGKLESVGVLAGGIAHDFNNILTAVLGNILLTKMSLPPEDPSYRRLAEAEIACLRAKDLTKQLLTFSTGGEPVRRATSIVGLAHDASAFALRGSKVKCEYDLPRDLWQVDVDDGQIRQAINNLVINAQQAMPGGGTIRIRGENVTLSMESPGDGAHLPPGRYVRLSIEDEGGGIPKENLHRIFDPYFTTKPKGSGLGLSIAYSIVTKHEGRIGVESRVGVGSVFHIVLPASARREAAHADAGGGAASPPSRGRILVMDDEDAIKDVAGGMLRLFGFDPDFAGDGAEAIALYRRARASGRPYAAVILDLTIPGGMGGEETMRRLRAIDPKVRAIVSSGYSTDPIMADYRNHGFRGVVAKPFGLEELRHALESIFGRPRG